MISFRFRAPSDDRHLRRTSSIKLSTSDQKPRKIQHLSLLSIESILVVLYLRLSPPERRYADVLGLSDWPRYPDSGLAEPKGNKLHDLR